MPQGIQDLKQKNTRNQFHVNKEYEHLSTQ